VLAQLAGELVWKSAQMFGTEADFVQMLDHAIAQIETHPGLCYGQTVADRNAVTGRKANTVWVTDVDADRFYGLLLEALRLIA
jgi:inosine-uridine nucleoside N-ribohydrolase